MCAVDPSTAHGHVLKSHRRKSKMERVDRKSGHPVTDHNSVRCKLCEHEFGSVLFTTRLSADVMTGAL